MTVIEFVPIIISVLAFGFSLYTYCKHDRKIKEQDELINKFTLEQFEKEKELEKRAIIQASVIKRDKGRREIKVYNKGKATAKNVVVTFPESPNLIMDEYPSPIDILPQDSIEIRTNIFYGSPSTTKIAFEWEDGFKLDNRGSQVIQL